MRWRTVPGKLRHCRYDSGAFESARSVSIVPLTAVVWVGAPPPLTQQLNGSLPAGKRFQYNAAIRN